MKNRMGTKPVSGYAQGASTAEREQFNIDDCFGETDVFDLGGRRSEEYRTQRLRIRTNMAKTYWYLAVGAYVALFLFALLDI